MTPKFKIKERTKYGNRIEIITDIELIDGKLHYRLNNSNSINECKWFDEHFEKIFEAEYTPIFNIGDIIIHKSQEIETIDFIVNIIDDKYYFLFSEPKSWIDVDFEYTCSLENIMDNFFDSEKGKLIKSFIEVRNLNIENERLTRQIKEQNEIIKKSINFEKKYYKLKQDNISLKAKLYDTLLGENSNEIIY